MAETVIQNPAGVFGLTATLFQQSYDFQSAESSTTISAGMLCSLNTSGKILKATTGVAPELIVGVAVADIVAGAVGLVCVQGFITAAAEGAISAGASVFRSSVTAGSVKTTAGDATVIVQQTIGVAVAAAASNLCLIYVNKA